MSSTAVHAPHHPPSYALSRSSSAAASRYIPPAAPSPPKYPSPPPAAPPPTTTTTMTNSQWLFSEAAIAGAPSVVAGLTPVEERARRAKGVNFIVQAGMLLKVPQVTLGSAAVFFHRFYMRVGMVGDRGVHHYVSLTF
jgi:protein BUR2